jgi:hypothetical protein
MNNNNIVIMIDSDSNENQLIKFVSQISFPVIYKIIFSHLTIQKVTC